MGEHLSIKIINDWGRYMYSESFTDKVIEHFMTPRNCGTMLDADGEGSSGDPQCGDYLTIQIKIKDNYIEDIRRSIVQHSSKISS